MNDKKLYAFYTDKLIEDFRKIVYSPEFDCKNCPLGDTRCLIDVLLCEDERSFKEAIIKKYSREVEVDE